MLDKPPKINWENAESIDEWRWYYKIILARQETRIDDLKARVGRKIMEKHELSKDAPYISQARDILSQFVTKVPENDKQKEERRKDFHEIKERLQYGENIIASLEERYPDRGGERVIIEVASSVRRG
ncbi:hypothetical protein S7711_10566 [Stachybotrys chartarum IBT 7711]|uniref:Uncharacterized protein n=1 Tax=Stachybotrys chartarum (strain CBS 109288 / IBT 7711) TaxID=1280523 RepID=A0A084B0Z9_STACB|nr:hypothetical protein S7711_10566 [Stachybotrys chartarum IBT 7711]KFA56447.1 hypothetical protein S40293_10884 [Stachybotrys chartarum IBT 40293]KFA71189.1 hypothetical protein S40288_10949 [Stachybotrys chartarum IBT 40288]